MFAKLLRLLLVSVVAPALLMSSTEAADPLRIAIIGDSTVCDYPADKPERGWGMYLGGYFVPDTVQVMNFAKSGRSSKTFITEGLWAKTLAAKPDIILIQFGHNDSHAKGRPEATDAANDFQGYLRQYITESRKSGATPILITPVHRRTFNADGTLNDNLKPYRNAMIQVAAEQKVALIDLHMSSGKLLIKLGDKKSNEEHANKPGDRTHFNEKGARAMAELVMNELPTNEPRLNAKLIKPKPPQVQIFVPGFTAQQLPVKLTNLINIEYAPDGRLFAAGYDGRVHMLTDTNGDGLEDKVTTFWDKTSADYPLGMVYHDKALYILHKNELVRFVDTNRDDTPDKREVVLKDWDDSKTANHPLILRRRVDYGMGLAIGPDGSIYIGMGNGAYNNAYMIDTDGKLGEKGKSHYEAKNGRGCVLKFSPDGKKKEILLTGVRYLMSMQFNYLGDLFATDQEGATWMPNGNPFDELLHLQPGRHYGFPPRHPKYLPNVIDEPSVYDYGPQHQSLCGFRFNDGKVFGPSLWKGDALIAGFTRGKLYRTQLSKTDVGYVAQNQLLADIQSLAADISISPQGDLAVACHTGQPDWGTGPQGAGLIYKIRYSDSQAPLPVATWSAGPGEFRVAFDKQLDPQDLKSLAKHTSIYSGKYVTAGDRFETIRPGYEVVKQQVATPRHEVTVLSSSLSTDGRTIHLNTPPNQSAWNYALRLPGIGRKSGTAGDIAQESAIDLQTDLTGVATEWKAASGPEVWNGWLPHANIAVASQFTQGSSEHERLASLLKKPGILTLRGQLDLWQMLQPAIQPLSKLDYERPIETVSVVVTANAPFRFIWGTTEFKSAPDATSHRVIVKSPGRENQWYSYTAIVPTSETDIKLQFSWYTDLDERPRAFPLRRFLLPWAVPATDKVLTVADRAKMPQLAGGDWQRGRNIFHGNIANCSKCHQVRGEGAKIGPDLSNLVHRDYASVLRDILEPSAAINPDYLSYTVTTLDGRSFTGLIHADSKDKLTVADSGGKLIEVFKKDIDTTLPSKVSVMPQDVTKQLQPHELRDLMTFLLLEPTAPPKK